MNLRAVAVVFLSGTVDYDGYLFRVLQPFNRYFVPVIAGISRGYGSYGGVVVCAGVYELSGPIPIG